MTKINQGYNRRDAVWGGGIISVKDYTIAALVGLAIFAGIVSGYFYFIPTLLHKKKIVVAGDILT